MYKKLLKYDLAAVWKVWLIIASVVVGMSVVTSLLIRGMIEFALAEDTTLYAIMSTILTTLVTGAMIVSYMALLIVVPIMCYFRYYKNFFSDEGYLTFTLPISRKDLYISKVLNTLIFSVGNFLVTILVVGIMCLVIPPATESAPVINPVVFKFFGQNIAAAWETVGGWLILYFLVSIVLLVLVEFYNIALIYLSITVGATVAKKHKLLAGIGIYMGATSVLSFFGQFFSLFSVESVAGLIVLIGTRPDPLVNPTIILCMILVGLALATLAFILHLITLNTIEKKLNLA